MHELERLAGPEEMAGALDRLADHRIAQSLVGNLDAAERALHHAEHVVVDDERLEGTAEQALLHGHPPIRAAAPLP